MTVFSQPLRVRSTPAALAATLLLASGCVTSELVPTDMEPQIARDLPYESLKAEPEKYKGRVVVLGGKVLSSKRLKEGTQIEVLQLPLDQADAPIMTLAQSKGRFLAYQEEFLDPATLPTGTAVSMIAEVTGAKTLPLDEVEYTYPTLKIRTLKIWPENRYIRPWPYPYYPYLYRYPYHPFYPFWWDPWY
ncbi:MAG TPA: Slp family lipoprotein [Nitrospirales bacterium]|nr:Slp family lipoprotein [Nitrospirales bacterium]